MKIIVAGPPKTGTTSMCSALRRLGYAVYDSDEQIDLQLDDWYTILVGGEDPFQHLKRMYKHIDAVTDGPAYYFWEQLLKVFPDAKVILLVRDEDAWARSYKYQKELEYRHRWLTRLSSKLHKVFEVVDAVEKLSMGSENYIEYMYRWKFHLHNERVRVVVPPTRLLEFSFKDGWKPLCEFLGVEEPNEDFPHENQAACDFKAEFRSLTNEIVGTFLLKCTVVLGACGAVVYCLRRLHSSD